MVTPEEISELKKIEGKVRGAVLQTDGKYVRSRFGEDGLKKVEQRLAELNVPISYATIRTSELYPLYLRIASILVIREVFNLSDDDIKKMGEAASKVSFIMRMMFKFFVGPETAFKNAGILWRRHYDVGNLEFNSYDPAGSGSLILKNFKSHPVYCLYLQGFIGGGLQLSLPDKKPRTEEKKCALKGDDGHEFWLYW